MVILTNFLILYIHTRTASIPKFPPIPIPRYSLKAILPIRQIAILLPIPILFLNSYNWCYFSCILTKKLTTLKCNYLLLSTSSHDVNNQLAVALNQTRANYI